MLVTIVNSQGSIQCWACGWLSDIMYMMNKETDKIVLKCPSSLKYKKHSEVSGAFLPFFVSGVVRHREGNSNKRKTPQGKHLLITHL